jgi:hypothetical protein
MVEALKYNRGLYSLAFAVETYVSTFALSVLRPFIFCDRINPIYSNVGFS